MQRAPKSRQAGASNDAMHHRAARENRMANFGLPQGEKCSEDDNRSLLQLGRLSLRTRIRRATNWTGAENVRVACGCVQAP